MSCPDCAMTLKAVHALAARLQGRSTTSTDYERGAADERAAVVEWLKNEWDLGADTWRYIERGAHRGSK